MQITLTSDQEAWIRSRIVAGEFASIEEAARSLIEAGIAEYDIEADDLAWAKPLVDEGIAALERGEFVSREEFRAKMDTLMLSLSR